MTTKKIPDMDEVKVSQVKQMEKEVLVISEEKPIPSGSKEGGDKK